jgi:FkbM family methyltransferase
MISKLLDLYAFMFAKKIFQKFNSLIFLAGARGLGILNYKSSYMSGEEPFLAKFLKRYDESGYLVLDVGANQGQFAIWALQNTDKIRVRSYEPSLHATSRLRSNPILNTKRHLLIEMGVSSKAGISVIYDYENNEGSEHASLYSEVLTDLHGSESVSSIEIRLTTLDEDLKKTPEKIALLKIDVEGHERDVLIGAKEILAVNPPAAILVEFNEMNAVSGTHYYGLRRLIGDQYVPYRLLPGGDSICLQGLSPLFTEICAYQNLVFLRR